MSKTDTEKLLQRNIYVYGAMKIFTKRVFLPLMAIYLVEVGGLSIAQIALLATLSPLVSLVMEVPAGYFADRLTRKAALFVSAVTLMLMSIILAVYPSFWGAVVATILESIGYSFLSGAAEALIHDTLVEQKRAKDYTKILSRAQSIGLFGNVILVALVGLTYKINPHMPFIISIFAYLALFVLASLLYEPERVRVVLHHNPAVDLAHNLKQFVNRHTILLFLTVGILTGLYFGLSDFNNLIFKDLGMPPNLLGLVYAASSLLAIGLSIKAQLLKKIGLLPYLLLDTFLYTGFMFGIGMTRNLLFMIVATLLSLAFFRLRQIVYQHHLLEIFPDVTNKATLLSTLAFFGDINELWIPVVFGASIVHYGYYQSYAVGGVTLAIILTLLSVLAVRLLATAKSSGRRLEGGFFR